MDQLTKRVVARFKAPRTGFPPGVEAVVQQWTEKYEKATGHDFKDWRLHLKGHPDRGWGTGCLYCNADMSVTIGKPRGKVTEHDESTDFYLSGFRIDEPCEQTGVELVRGLAVGSKEELLSSPNIAKEVLDLVTKDRGLGEHWTNPGNVGVAKAFAMKKDGLPVVIHAEFWRSDQRRNYKPKGFRTLEDFHYEQEDHLGNNEIVRLQSIEWYDGSTWVSQSLNGLKVKT